MNTHDQIEELKAEKLQLEIELLKNQIRESSPHLIYTASVEFCLLRSQYRCYVQDWEGDEGDAPGTVVEAYGESPQEACDNFDRLWRGEL